MTRKLKQDETYQSESNQLHELKLAKRFWKVVFFIVSLLLRNTGQVYGFFKRHIYVLYTSCHLCSWCNHVQCIVIRRIIYSILSVSSRIVEPRRISVKAVTLSGLQYCPFNELTSCCQLIPSLQTSVCSLSLLSLASNRTPPPLNHTFTQGLQTRKIPPL